MSFFLHDKLSWKTVYKGKDYSKYITCFAVLLYTFLYTYQINATNHEEMQGISNSLLFSKTANYLFNPPESGFLSLLTGFQDPWPPLDSFADTLSLLRVITDMSILYELWSKLLLSPLITPIVVPYIIPYIPPFKEFTL